MPFEIRQSFCIVFNFDSTKVINAGKVDLILHVDLFKVQCDFEFALKVNEFVEVVLVAKTVQDKAIHLLHVQHCAMRALTHSVLCRTWSPSVIVPSRSYFVDILLPFFLVKLHFLVCHW